MKECKQYEKQMTQKNTSSRHSDKTTRSTHNKFSDQIFGHVFCFYVNFLNYLIAIMVFFFFCFFHLLTKTGEHFSR